MGVLLDARTSQNASYANSISIVNTTANVTQLVGQIGLQVPSSTTGVIRVQLEGTVTAQLPILIPEFASVTVTIVRGTLPTDLLIYSAKQPLILTILGPQILTVAASDYKVPAPSNGLLVYTMFVSSDAVGTIRVGPESFNGAAYTE